MRNALLSKRYLLPGETEGDMYNRVARFVWKANSPIISEMMKNGRFLPNTPTLANAGTSRIGGLSACYVLFIEDSLEGICTAVREQALVHKYFGGTGFDLTPLRAEGAPIASTGGSACGPIKVLQLLNQSAETVSQGGKREGANMGILGVDHPDVREFICCKSRKELRHFNISVSIPDDFMCGGDMGILDEIATSATRTGDPGCIFIDAIERGNPTPALGRITATNPCITGDAIVPTYKGLKYMSDIKIGDMVYVGGNVFETIIETFDIGVQPVFEITTERGYRLKCTADHRICTESGLKPVGDLTLSDKVECQVGGYVPEGGDFDEGYLAGVIYGDGWVSSGRVGISFSNEDAEEASRLVGYINSKFNTHLTIREYTQQSGNTVLRIMTGQRPFYKFGNICKDISCCMGRHKEWLRGFISGWLFADGHVERGNSMSIALSCSDKAALDVFQTILMQFGIYTSNVYTIPRHGHDTDEKYGFTSYKQSYRVQITGEDKQLLIDSIPMRGSIQRNLDIQRTGSSRKGKHLQRIVSIVECKPENVYDFTTDGKKLFFANGLRTLDCGEQPLLPYESCNLGSLNLSKYVIEGEFDYDSFIADVWIAVEFLDRVITCNSYPLQKIDEASKKTRKIGLGIMGWADALVKMGVSYSDTGKVGVVIDRIGKTLRDSSIEASERIAESMGVFPAWEDSTWEKQGIELRNATLTTIAPTGSISFLAGCSSGIEPIFEWKHTRTSEEGSTVIESEVYEIAKRDGLLDDVSHKIDGDVHVFHQAQWQKYIDNAVSKTINLPSGVGWTYVKNLMMTAWETGCKGITVYVDGSKAEQVLTVDYAPVSTLKEGMKRRLAHVYEAQSGCGVIRVIPAMQNDTPNQLHEVYVLTAGGCAANNETTGRLISDELQNGIPVGVISETLHKVKCVNAMKNPRSLGKSCADIIAMCIDIEQKDFIDRTPRTLFKIPICPDCGEKLTFEGGCGIGACPNCGWGGCS